MMVRLVYRPYTHIRRTICTSVSLRASTRVSPGFALYTHSSPSFGSRQICSYSNLSENLQVGRWCGSGSSPRRARKDCFPPRSAEPTFTFIARRLIFRDRKGLDHPGARIYVRLLGPCFKTGRLKPFCHKKTSSRHRCGPRARRGRRNRQAQVTCPRRFPTPGARLPRRGMPLGGNLFPFPVSSVWLLASADFRSVTRRGRGEPHPRRHLPTGLLPGRLSYLSQTHVDPPARRSARARNGPVLPKPGTPRRALEDALRAPRGSVSEKTADSPTGEYWFQSLPF